MYILSVPFVLVCCLYVLKWNVSAQISGRNIIYTNLNTTKIIIVFWSVTVENPEALQAFKLSPVDTLHSNSAADRCIVWFNNHTYRNLPVNVLYYITKSFIKIPGLGLRYTKEQKLK
jgi:hypothetical protein